MLLSNITFNIDLMNLNTTLMLLGDLNTIFHLTFSAILDTLSDMYEIECTVVVHIYLLSYL